MTATAPTNIPAISVIVPIFNTERYLHQCVKSLMDQTLKDLEIILVDDGSTDGSGAICDEYAARDSRIKVIHKENGGSASARQAGLDAATGEYIIVCDSDDWLEHDAYEKVYTKAKDEDADLVFFGYVANYEDGEERTWIRTYSDLNDIELTRAEIMQTSAYTSWNKLVRRSLFVENGLHYEPGINMGEDVIILHKLLNIRPLKLALLPEALYHYRQREGGYTHAMKKESVLQLCKVQDWTWRNIDSRRHKMSLEGGAVNIAFESLRCDSFPRKEFSRLVKDIKIKRLVKSPRSPQKLMVLIGTLMGWRWGRLAYKHIFLRMFAK